jgi:sugar-specific transcriptional regulator TrmB
MPAAKRRKQAGVRDRAELVDTDELTRLLVALGLTHNESRVYLAMLGAVEVTAAEAASRAGVPRPKVYEALQGLEERGFCRSSGARVRSHAAVDPRTALQGWLRHRDHERSALAERDQAHVETLTRALPTLAAAPQVEIPDFIEAVSGRVPTSQLLEEVMSRAKASLYEMLQPPFIQPRTRWNVKEIEALDRGVDVRVVYTAEALADRRRYVPLLEAGASLRVAERLPMKLLIRDDAEALISLRDTSTGVQSVTTARVNHPDLVAPLHTLFEQVWSEARPIEPDEASS